MSGGQGKTMCPTVHRALTEGLTKISVKSITGENRNNPFSHFHYFWVSVKCTWPPKEHGFPNLAMLIPIAPKIILGVSLSPLH